MKPVFLISAFILLVSCSNPKTHFDEQAHRGGRGLMPENTIASQKTAIDYGATLEMDLQMSKDKKIVVSHDAYFSSKFCLDLNGKPMTKEEGRSRLLYDMPYDSVAQYDCGSKPHPDFPQQKNLPAHKPLLSVLIDSVETYAKGKGHINHYNIEIKSSPKADGKHYSSLEAFVDSAMAVIERKGIAERTMIQSFDERALRRVHEKWPQMEIAYLDWAKDTAEAQIYINALGFKPDIFSPNFRYVTETLIRQFHELDIKVIPWTPNTVEEMQKIKDMGADGVI